MAVPAVRRLGLVLAIAAALSWYPVRAAASLPATKPEPEIRAAQHPVDRIARRFTALLLVGVWLVGRDVAIWAYSKKQGRGE